MILGKIVMKNEKT